jgi:LysM repeat protein
MIPCLFLAGILAGCLPSSEGNLDEQKDPHYLNGRAKVTSLDHKGAIEEFEKALEANPRNAAAHLELGLLYENPMKDYAAAIYHFEQHLKLRPNSDYAERAKERINACKMDLVKGEVLGPVNQGMQKEMERLTTENMLLKQRVETLEAQIAGRPVTPVQPPTRVQAPVTNTIPQNAVAQNPAGAGSVTRNAKSPFTGAGKAETHPEPVRSKGRAYTVKAGDTPRTIAREQGVEVMQLMKANPGVDPTKLKIGQTLNIP